MAEWFDGYIKPEGRKQDIEDFIWFVEQKDSKDYSTGRFKNVGKVYIREKSEEALMDFVNAVEEKFRDMNFEAFFCDKDHTLAWQVDYNKRVETVVQFSDIDLEAGTMKKVGEYTEEVTDECIQERHKEQE